MIGVKLEKYIWTDKDFNIMDWHDVTVHAIAITPKDDCYERQLNIDYIFEWIQPREVSGAYSFRISPATLVFENVWDIKSNITTRINVLENINMLEVIADDISNDKSNIGMKSWKIVLNQGAIEFIGSGFKQYIRNKPILSESIWLDDEERNGISFSRNMNAG